MTRGRAPFASPSAVTSREARPPNHPRPIEEAKWPERGENGASLTSPWQRIESGPIRDPPEQRLESLGFSAVGNENGEYQSRILSPLRLPFRHPGHLTTIILRCDCSLPEGYERAPISKAVCPTRNRPLGFARVRDAAYQRWGGARHGAL